MMTAFASAGSFVSPRMSIFTVTSVESGEVVRSVILPTWTPITRTGEPGKRL